MRAARAHAVVTLTLCATTLPGCCAVCARPPHPAPPSAAPSPAREPFTQVIPGTIETLEMIPVPAPAGASTRLWFSRTEITWDLYDVFVYGLDEAESDNNTDAVTRPSQPYIAMDRGFGHAGYAALSMSHHAAETFCQWLSAKTGRVYRLPTEDQWLFVCARSGIDSSNVADYGWCAENADRKAHPVASKPADDLGLHDLAGNASEWCTGEGGEPVTLGGSYKDPASAIGCAGLEEPTEDWNASDPQFPKSIWWLADAGFVGFRVVCEGPAP